MSDGVTKVATYFPTYSLVSFWILSNLIINNQPFCRQQDRDLIIALIVIFCIMICITACTDTYTASNQQKFAVLLIPFYGPACFNLPTPYDKDRVFQHYFFQAKDLMHAIVAMTTFLIIVLFVNPVSMCLFPSKFEDGTARFDPSIIRTIPIVIGILGALIMMGLGEPRQVLGYGNSSSTTPALTPSGPIITGPGGIDQNIPEEGEKGKEGQAPSIYGSYRGGTRSSYQGYAQRTPSTQSQRSAYDGMHGVH